MAVVATLDVLLRAQTQKFDAGIKRSQAMIAGLAGSMKAFSAIGGAGLFASAVRSTLEFEREFKRSTAIMGTLSDNLTAKMRHNAHLVAEATMFTNAQVAQSYYFLASAGLSAEQSLAALPTVAKFAQAGMFDMARATDLLTDAQSALGLSVSDAEQNMANMTRVSDALIAANTMANATAEQFSVALTTKFAGAAKLAGWQVEEAVAVLAAFADQGVKGEEAGTRATIMLRDLQTKALQNAEAFEALGVSVFDSNGQTRHAWEILQDLEKALAGASARTIKQTFLMLGFADKSVDATSALLGLSGKIEEYHDRMKDMEGITDHVSDKVLTKFETRLNKIKGALSGAITEGLGPAIEYLTSAWDPYLNALDKVRKMMDDHITPSFERLAAAIYGGAPALTTATAAAGGGAGVNANAPLFGGSVSGGSPADRLLAIMRADKAEAENIKRMEAHTRRMALLREEARRKEMAAAEAKAMEEKRMAEELMRRRDALKREGESIKDSLRTSAEVYRDTIADLVRLRKVGAIDNNTLFRGLLKAGEERLDDLRRGREDRPLGPAAVLGGTQEGFAALARARQQAAESADEKRDRKELVEFTKRIWRTLEDGGVLRAAVLK